MSRKMWEQEIMQTEPAGETPGQEKRGQKDGKNSRRIWLWAAVLSLTGALIMLMRYMHISGILELEDPSVTDKMNTEMFSRYNYVLYRDLYNAVNGTSLSYEQLYGDGELSSLEPEIDEGMTEYAEYRMGMETFPDATESSGLQAAEEGIARQISDFWKNSMQQDVSQAYSRIEERLNTLTNTMQSWPYSDFDYWMQDQETGTIVTNTLQTDAGQPFSVEGYAVWFMMTYDANGNVLISGAEDSNADALARTLYESARKGVYEAYIGADGFLANHVDYTDTYWLSQVENVVRGYGGPENCTVIYGIKQSQWENVIAGDRYYNQFSVLYEQYETDNLGVIYLGICAALFFWGFFYGNPRKEEKRRKRQFFRIPAEAAALGCLLCLGMCNNVVEWAVTLYQEHNPHYYLRTWWSWPDILAYGANLLVIAGLFFLTVYLGCCIGEVRLLGIREYLRRRIAVFRVWNWCKERIRRYYQTLVSLDITRNTRKQVIRLLLINAVVVLMLCTMWFAGWFGVIIYTLLLYFVIKKYISDLQKKFSILLQATNEIANGNLDVKIEEHLGIFEPFKPQIYRIEEGFQKAVEEEVKSQRMKTELITNVSHDLKTPLTAIITYVNLLKEDNVTEEQRKQYLQILDQKSLRLKALIEDLFEVSKANSKNITLNLVDVDIVNLLRQVEFEQEDRLAEKHLTVRLRLPEEKLLVRLDSQKAYRIYENLFGNIAKYAMEGTRIYVDLECAEDEVTVKLKNITEQEITVSAEELTERFVRGDASRNTEGSGLGLAIVRSFTELMGGRFSVAVDGDLFTASTTWPLAKQNAAALTEGR